jgi:hypothetical protein
MTAPLRPPGQFTPEVPSARRRVGTGDTLRRQILEGIPRRSSTAPKNLKAEQAEVAEVLKAET